VKESNAIELTIANETDSVPSAQLLEGRVDEGVQLGFPVVVSLDVGLRNFLRVGISRVTHELIAAALLQSWKASPKIPAVQPATLGQAKQARCRLCSRLPIGPRKKSQNTYPEQGCEWLESDLIRGDPAHVSDAVRIGEPVNQAIQRRQHVNVLVGIQKPGSDPGFQASLDLSAPLSLDGGEGYSPGGDHPDQGISPRELEVPGEGAPKGQIEVDSEIDLGGRIEQQLQLFGEARRIGEDRRSRDGSRLNGADDSPTDRKAVAEVVGVDDEINPLSRIE
jgi:hypothetical protein